MSKKLLRKKLALMLATLKKKRKYYCEVEYLESTGTQWIDTGIKGKNNLDFDYKAVFTNVTTSSGYGIGGEWQSGNSFYLGLIRSDGTFAYHYGNADSPVVVLNSVSANTPYVIKGHMWNDEQYMVINGTKSSVGTVSGTFTATENIALFRVSSSSPIYSYAKIYYLKIWDNGVLVRDMIPVLDWDMKPCMFDKITERLFYNQATSGNDFSYGREIHYVDYLESTGTQWIDTGIVRSPSSGDVYKLSARANYPNTTSRQIMGTQGSFYFGVVGGKLQPGLGRSNTVDYAVNPNEWYDIDIIFDTTSTTARQQYTINGTSGTVNQSFSNVPENATFWAFAANNDTTIRSKCKLSRFAVYVNDVLVRDFIPAIDSDGVGFMLDKGSHTIYDNAGTGVFKYPARETEYTANAATSAYIDLGVKYKPSMTIEGKYTRNSYGNSGSVMLLTTTTSSPLIFLPALADTTAERFIWRRSGYTEQSYYINDIQYPFTVEMKIDAVNDILTINNEIVKTGMIAGMNGYNSPYESSSNMYMFSIAGNYPGDGKTYYLKITDGTMPLFDLIPAYKDGEAGFYNKVDGTFYKNTSTQSTEKLTAGKIIEPEYE